MKKTFRKRIITLVALACIFASIGLVSAYFTDYVTNVDSPFEVTADENAIIIEPTDPEVPTPEYPDDPGKEIEHIWEVKNEDKEDLIAPGDYRDLSYTLNNKGNSAIDVRETLVLTSTEDMNINSPEFRLFLDATADKYGAMVGGTVVSAEAISARSIKYTIAPFVLSGAEETVEGAAKSIDRTYIFVFDKYASNAFQADKCTIDYLIEVKQHTKNGPTGGWTEVADVELTLGTETLKVVPKAE